MSKNPYVQKFSQAFNTGLFIVVFLVLAVVAACVPEPAHAEEQGNFPVTCFTSQEFRDQYQSKQFELYRQEVVVIFVDGEAISKYKILTRSTKNKKTVEGTWIVDGKLGSGKEVYCLTWLQDLGKVVDL